MRKAPVKILSTTEDAPTELITFLYKDFRHSQDSKITQSFIPACWSIGVNKYRLRDPAKIILTNLHHNISNPVHNRHINHHIRKGG